MKGINKRDAKSAISINSHKAANLTETVKTVKEAKEYQMAKSNTSVKSLLSAIEQKQLEQLLKEKATRKSYQVIYNKKPEVIEKRRAYHKARREMQSELLKKAKAAGLV